MDLKEIKQIIDLAKQEGLSEFEFEKKDLKLAFSFVSKQQHTSYAPAAPFVTETPAASKMTNVDQGLHVIKSPFVGTFYAASAPGKADFVKVGDRVSPGQTLCILEAMKIMNEIDSDCSGEIVEICAENESLVEFDQPLFKVRK